MKGLHDQGSFGSSRGEANPALQARLGLPSTEIMLAKYHCALRTHSLSLCQGRLYIFPKHVAFVCDVIGQTQAILVKLVDVSHVKKAKTLMLLPNAIDIRLIDGKSFFLTSFLSRNEAYHQIYDLWSISKGIEQAGNHCDLRDVSSKLFTAANERCADITKNTPRCSAYSHFGM